MKLTTTLLATASLALIATIGAAQTATPVTPPADLETAQDTNDNGDWLKKLFLSSSNGNSNTPVDDNGLTQNDDSVGHDDGENHGGEGHDEGEGHDGGEGGEGHDGGEGGEGGEGHDGGEGGEGGEGHDGGEGGEGHDNDD